MGRLKDMIAFLDTTYENIMKTRNRLSKLQTYFNDNFINVNRVREEEITFLQKSYLEDPKQFPETVITMHKKFLVDEERKFTENLKKLQDDALDLKKKYNAVNNAKEEHLKKRKKTNVRLDTSEEKLKKKIGELDTEISDYNKKIDELNSGLGFIANLFKMRTIHKKKEVLIDKREELVEEIESVRQKWTMYEQEYVEREQALQEEWNVVQVDYAVIDEKTKTLNDKREELITKAAFLVTLEQLAGDEKFLTARMQTDPVTLCPRCKSDNEANLFFCNYCGERFSGDRPDIAGSLVEVGELNRVYDRLQAGMRETVSILALLKGIGDGIRKFTKSVDKVKFSQDKYPSLSTLMIDVPQESRDFAGMIEQFSKMAAVSTENLHPDAFAASLKSFIETNFTEENIEQFFMKMGDELNLRTREQWR